MELIHAHHEEEIKEARAWILNIGADMRVAVAYHEMEQVLLDEPVFHIPCAPSYCNQAIIRYNRVLPLMNIAALLQPGANIEKGNTAIGVAVYQEAPGKPLHRGCMQLTSNPKSALIKDEYFCDLPTDSELWEDISLSCFMFEKRVIPVIDLAVLFSSQLRDKLNATGL